MEKHYIIFSPTSQTQSHSGCSMPSCSRRHRGACMPPAVPWLHCRRGWWYAAGCHGHYHVGCEDGAVCTFDAFRLYLKYLTHSKLFIGSYFSCHADWRQFLSKGKGRGK